MCNSYFMNNCIFSNMPDKEWDKIKKDKCKKLPGNDV